MTKEERQRRGHRPATKHDETPEFKEMWETVWPAIKSPYDGRALARDAYFRHVWFRGAEEQDILDASKFYVRGSSNTETRRLLFSNWLDRGAYEDLAVSERQYQRRVAEVMARRQQETNVVPIDDAKRREMAERVKGVVQAMRAS